AAQKGCEVIGEIALFQRLKGAVPVLAVTGTDGKSTTTTWLAAMCEASGRPTWAGGNLGNPLCESVDELTPEHVVVAEVSCFQLSTAAEFHPQAAIVTNLAPDHLDYYQGSYDAYTNAKARVMANLGVGDSAVLNADDPLLSTWSAPSGATTFWFSR
ncbi:MAG TPA: UDP-N-acetylmuramoyl-L-alanine--D-glutamate ligase, partial [Myxococcales bacterium]|nr:UDP-N-acetylmuramoyl-L-alanine--D-glutamate ligase [Myxococcales bacterium]